MSRRKNDPDKLEIAARLRRETTLTIKEIVARMHLGSSKGANSNLHKHMQRRTSLKRDTKPDRLRRENGERNEPMV